MRLLWLLGMLVAACGGKEANKKKVYEDAAPAADALQVTDAASRDRLFLSVPTTKAVEGVIERLSARPHVAGTPANEEVAKEIMRTLGRMGWKLGTQQYDVYLPHPKKIAVRVLGDAPVEISTAEPAAAAHGSDPTYATWNAYSASGKVRGALFDGGLGRPDDLKGARGKVVLLRYGPLYRGVQVASAERAGAVAVIFYNDPQAEPDRPRDSAQRGTVLYYWQHPGDPVSPGWPSLPGDARRERPDGLEVLPKIPVVNLTAAEAEKLRASPGTVEVEVEMDGATRPIRNLIAILEGKSKEAVILGNHYDAWGPGAIDPHSGTATLIEIARGLTALQRAGWRPRRTIVIAFWDAEEMGVIGSTEWVEHNLEMLTGSAIAYFNVDTIRAAELAVQGSPALHDHVRACAADVTNPVTGKPFAPKLGDLGIGSDHTAFAHHAGIATLHWYSAGEGGKYVVWHSMLDDLERARTQTDPGLVFVPAFAKVMGLCAIRLADAERLPFRYTATASWVAAALDALPRKPDRAKLDAALSRLRDAAAVAEQAAPSPACDAAMIAAERGLLDPSGIAGRPWYRNLAVGPDPDNGYAALPLPELAAASRSGFGAKAMDKPADRLAAAIERVATALAPCR